MERSGNVKPAANLSKPIRETLNTTNVTSSFNRIPGRTTREEAGNSSIGASASQFTKDIHKMGQDFGRMTESLSRSSNLISESVAQISQDFHQASRYLMVTCISLATFALATSMTHLQDSSCDYDWESAFCTAPLKSMAAATIVTGFVAIGMFMPNRVQRQMYQNSEILTSKETTSVIKHSGQFPLNERIEPNFFILEEGVDQSTTSDGLDMDPAYEVFLRQKYHISEEYSKAYPEDSKKVLLLEPVFTVIKIFPVAE